MHRRPRPPIPIAPVLDDPDQIRRLVERHAPYLPVQRYFRSDAEFDASSGTRPDGGAAIIAPNFRGDWAFDRPLVDGVEPLLNHSGFVEAAGKLFDSSLVRPQIVYVNLTWRLPFDQGAGHIDVPAFRGIDRTRYPIWLLNAMGHSGLFEEERIRIATAVAWFYRGADGGFTCWPDGPDAPPVVHEQIDSVTPKPPSSNNRYPETRVEVRLKGTTLRQLVQLLHKIETGRLYLIVRSLRILTRGQEQQVLDVSFSVSSFERA